MAGSPPASPPRPRPSLHFLLVHFPVFISQKLRTETGSVGIPARKRIGTHSGSFHVDEALACFLLQHYSNDFKDGEIIRSRDPQVWATCDILGLCQSFQLKYFHSLHAPSLLISHPLLVDVGDVYDPHIHRYDHHQRGFSHTLDAQHPIKLSSAGLIYKSASSSRADHAIIS